MNILPDLPKKNKKKEADFGLKFRQWLTTVRFLSCTFELKDSRGKDYINFAEIVEDQVAHALRTESEKGNLIRIEKGTIGAPDYVYLRNAPAYIVIHYPRSFEIITIGNLLHEKNTHKKKSLTSARARDISVMSVKLF